MSQEYVKMPVAPTGERSGAVPVPEGAGVPADRAEAPGGPVASADTPACAPQATARTLLEREDTRPGQQEKAAKTGPEGAAVRLSPEEYTIVLPENAPGDPVDTAVLDRFKCFCSSSGLTAEQAQRAVDFYMAEQGHALTGMHEQCEMILRSQWNERYAERMAMARGACMSLDRRMGGRLMPLVRAGLGSHPVFGELMALVGESMTEDSFSHSGAGSAPDEAMSTEEFLRTVVFKGR